MYPDGRSRQDVIHKRKEWQEKQKSLDITKLVFLDESGINLNMTRLYGWGKKNERVEDYVADVRFERTSIISAIGLNGYIAPMMFSGTLDGDLFSGYVKQYLVRELNKDDILILDNLSSHKVQGAVQPLIDKGIKILWLPPYSPDLNPIELSWSKVKSILRKLKATNLETLKEALKNALESVTKNDIKNWFKHNGYFFVPQSPNV